MKTKTRPTSSLRRGSSSPPDPATAYALGVVAGRIIAGPHVRAACARHLRDLKQGSARGLSWDPDRAAWVYDYFRSVLRLAGGEHEGKPFVLEGWEQFVVGSLFGWVGSDGYRRFRTGFVLTGKGPLALDTPVPTPSGWTTMGEIQVGDQVFDDAGKPCNVIGVSSVFHDRDCFWLRFNDGSQIVADAAHEWRTAALRSGCRTGRKPAHLPRKGGYATRTTAEIARTVAMPRSASKHPQARWNHRVDLCGPLQLPDATLPIPPYTFGAWLGDGDSDCARLTAAYSDWRIVEEIQAEGVPVREQVKHSITTARVALSDGDRRQAARNIGIAARLRALGVIGNKHIPMLYLRASAPQRMALLQGLMDTDGSALKGGAAELTLCDQRLARDAMELMRTLGYKPTVGEADAMLDGRKVGRRWRIRVQAYSDRPIFRLPRKAERLHIRPPTRALSEGRMIVGCEAVSSVPVRCITVDSSSHLFLAGEGMIPTHNSGKSPLAAGIGLYMLHADDEPRAEVYGAATKKDQAQVLFRDAVAMVQQSPHLSAHLVTSGGNPIWNLAHLPSGSFFRPISSDDGQSGPRPHCSLLDEIHEHKTSMMVDMMRAGTKGRRQALMFAITNAGVDRQSVCFTLCEYGEKVAAGQLTDDAFFAYICSIDLGDDPLTDAPDPELGYPRSWAKANPSIGVTFPVKYLEEQVREARGMPAKESIVRRLNFCEWVDAINPWVDGDLWRACEVHPPHEVEGLESEEACLGLDLGSKRDMVAAARVVRVGDLIHAELRYWTPADTMDERERMDRVPYSAWARDGFINAVPGRSIDYGFVVRDLTDWLSHAGGLAFDQWRIEDFLREMDSAGVDGWIWDPPKMTTGSGLRLMRHGQGWGGGAVELDPQGQPLPKRTLWMPQSISAIEDLVVNGRLKVKWNPCLTWNSASAVLDRDAAGNAKWEKRKSTGRIDGIVALSQAVGLAMAPLPKKPSYSIHFLGGG